MGDQNRLGLRCVQEQPLVAEPLVARFKILLTSQESTADDRLRNVVSTLSDPGADSMQGDAYIIQVQVEQCDSVSEIVPFWDAFCIAEATERGFDRE